jgi:hypothetical protein
VEDLLDLRFSAQALDLRTELAALRHDMDERESVMRQEIRQLRAALREDNEARHFDLLKWLVVFWISQAGASAVIAAGLISLNR